MQRSSAHGLGLAREDAQAAVTWPGSAILGSAEGDTRHSQPGRSQAMSSAP